MKNKYFFTFIFNLTTVLAIIALRGGKVVTAWSVLLTMAVLCLVSACLLADLSGRLRLLRALMRVACGVLMALMPEHSFPFILLMILQFYDILFTGSLVILLTAASSVLPAVLLPLSFEECLIGVVAGGVMIYVFSILKRLQDSHTKLNDNSAEINLLRDRLSRQRKTIRTLEHSARVSERNRLAARIHDKIGHTISGSVVLLEGALLLLKDKPQAAADAVQTATDNLRDSVDGIRAVLRQERANNGEIGLSDIGATLAKFESDHPSIKTALRCEGEAEKITPLVWRCLQENLTEALTNTLKHSNASHFSVDIIVMNQLVTARFRDNGSVARKTPQERGVGLAAMEERAALCGGRMFVHDEDGFQITTTFIKPKNAQENEDLYS
jgi:signal transduction histidine kinase